MGLYKLLEGFLSGSSLPSLLDFDRRLFNKGGLLSFQPLWRPSTDPGPMSSCTFLHTALGSQHLQGFLSFHLDRNKYLMAVSRSSPMSSELLLS